MENGKEYKLFHGTWYGSVAKIDEQILQDILDGKPHDLPMFFNRSFYTDKSSGKICCGSPGGRPLQHDDKVFTYPVTLGPKAIKSRLEQLDKFRRMTEDELEFATYSHERSYEVILCDLFNMDCKPTMAKSLKSVLVKYGIYDEGDERDFKAVIDGLMKAWGMTLLGVRLVQKERGVVPDWRYWPGFDKHEKKAA